MKQVIKNIDGNILFECEADSFKEAVEKAVREMSLFFADLRGADLSEAELSGADFAGADFSEADLSDVNLSGANLVGANLFGTNQRGADLYGADLRGANLINASLHVSSSAFAKFDDEIPEYLRVVPKEGEFIGWKKCRDGVIVKLLIPADAERSNGFSRKCRASKVVVMEVFGADFGVSYYKMTTCYRIRGTIHADKWDPKWWCECTNGIHFFLTREEAEKY